MSRAGRKRLAAVERYESGRIKPPAASGARGARSDGAPPAQVKRMLDECLRGAGDPRLGTALGRLFAYERIKAHQFAAGEAYARLRGRFDRATSVPRRTCQSPCYGEARSSGSDGEPLPERAYVALVTEHTKMLLAIGHRYPMLERACVDDTYVAEDELRSLKAALDDLAVYFGLVSKRGA